MDAGQLVREARKRAGLTQQALAGRVGISQPAVARIESGRTRATFDLALRLVRACGLDLDIRVVPLEQDAWATVERNARLTPDERLDRMLAGLHLRDAGERTRQP